MKNKYFFLIFFLILSIILRCTTNTPLDFFFDKLETSLDEHTIEEFKSVPKDSVLHYYGQFKDILLISFYDSSQVVKLNSFFDSMHIMNNEEIRLHYLLFAFHSKLNNEKIDNSDITNRIRDHILFIKSKIDEKAVLFKSQQHRIMQKNNIKYNIGDTLQLTLPVLFEGNEKSAGYCINHPSSLDCSNFDDTLRIIGKLVQKKFYAYPNLGNLDTNEITFKLRIIHTSNPNYKIFYKSYKINDSIDIHLSAYGKPIY